MLTTPTITTVPGRKAGHSNVIINGYRYTNDRKRGNKTYMKCVLYSNGCRARITLMDGELITPVPDHPTHDGQHSKTYVHVSKNAAQTDHPTKRLVAQVVSGMTFETRSKLNCQIRSLGKMARESRRIAHSYPTSARTLEELSLPADYTHSSSGETLLLWDSSYTTVLRRSFLFGTPTNTADLFFPHPRWNQNDATALLLPWS